MLIIFSIYLVKVKIIFTLSRPRIRFFLGLMMRMEAEFRLLPVDIDSKTEGYGLFGS
jgi:hypothetical protein